MEDASETIASSSHALMTPFELIWTNVDVLRCVLDELDRPSLVALCRTCWSLFEPSASVLWASLTRRPLRCLLNLLPADMVTIEFSDLVGVMEFSHDKRFGALRKTDLSRWNIYSRMVKSITLNFEDEDYDEKALMILRMLQNFSPDSTLIPKLNKIEGTSGFTHIQIILLLLSPSIRSLVIREGNPNPDYPDHLKSLFEWLPDKAPTLTGLSVKQIVLPDDVLAALAECLRKLPEIDELGVDFAGRPEVLFKALSAAQRVRALVINRWIIMRDGNIRTEEKSYDNGLGKGDSDRPDALFGLLRELNMASSIEFCTSTLQQFRPTLLSLQVNWFPPSSDALKAWLHVMHHTSPQIEVLRINWQGHVQPKTWKEFLALQRFDLRVFRMSRTSPLEIQDEDLLTIGKAWPGLTSLTFQEMPHNRPVEAQNYPSEPTLDGLLHLVKQCHALRSLHLPALMKSLESHLRLPVPRSEALVDLFIGRTAIDLLRLAGALYAICPEVTLRGLKGCETVNEHLETARFARQADRGKGSIQA